MAGTLAGRHVPLKDELPIIIAEVYTFLGCNTLGMKPSKPQIGKPSSDKDIAKQNPELVKKRWNKPKPKEKAKS